MGNKKNIIGLSILLLVFLLGLSTTSYASISDDYTYPEFKNIIYNIMTDYGTYNTTRATNFITDYNIDLLALYNTEGQYVVGRHINNEHEVTFLFYTNTVDNLHPYVNSGRTRIYVYNRSGSTQPYSYTATIDGDTSLISSTVSKNMSVSVSTTYWVTNTPIYTTTDGGSIVYQGISDSDLIDGPYQNIPPDPEMTFTPINPVGAEAIRVEDNVGIDCIGVEKNSTYKSMKFGDLYVPSYYYITNINVLWWYYNRGTDRWLYKYILQEDGDDITPSAYRSSIVNFKWEDSYKENETTIIHYSVWINRDFVINDTIYQIAVIGTKFKDGSPKYVGANYFIKSTYTTIVNGILDTDYIKNTPYGDEYNNIVGDIADKVDDLDDLTNSITAGIGNGLIGASGDWYPLNSLASGDDILGTAQLWGFRNYTNLYWQGIYQLLTNTFTVLGQTGSVDLDVSFHGYQKVISSDDIVSPPTAIKDFISLCMVTFTMIAIYRHFNKKIENIQAADTSKIKNEADDSNLM